MARVTIELAMKRICADLGLPEGDAFTQDWAYELGEEYRTESHLDRYLNAYRDPRYGERERELLVGLVLDVVNDLLQKEEAVGLRAWSRTLDVVGEHLAGRRDLLDRWALTGEPIEDAFALTPHIREFMLVRGIAST